MGYAWRMGDLASAGVLAVDTAQDLRDYPISDLPAVGPMRTLGAVSAGDGGGGDWDYLSGAAPGTYTDDGGITLVPTGGNGSSAWQRCVSDSLIHAAWWGLSEEAGSATANAEAIQCAIDAVPELTAGETYPLHLYGGRTVVIPDGVRLEIGAKLTVSPTRNVYLTCPTFQGATLVYTGPGNVAIEFQPGGRQHGFGCANLSIEDGDIAVVGGNSGALLFSRVSLYRPPAKGIWMVDSNDYTDGPGGEYSGGYTGPNVGVGINTVFFQIDECYVNNAVGHSITIEATTYLLGRIRKPRLIASGLSPLVLDCNGVHIEGHEMIGVGDPNYPFIWLPCTQTNSHITIRDGRFGSETINTTGEGPPKRAIQVGNPNGLSPAADGSSYVTIENNRFSGDSDKSIDLIGVNATITNWIIDNNRYNDYTGYGVAFQTNGSANECQWGRGNYEFGGSDLADISSNWTEEVREIARPGYQGPQPTVVLNANCGEGATYSLTSGNDVNGKLTITIGTNPGSGKLADITFNRRYLVAPIVSLTPGNSTAADAVGFHSGVTGTGFSVYCRNVPAGNLTFHYSVSGAGT